MSAMMKCPMCAEEIEMTSKTCAHCYAEITVPEQKSDSSISGGAVLMLTSLALFLCAIGLFGYQCLLYLKTGEWNSISVVSLAKMAKTNSDWWYYPTDWHGVHSILDGLPASGTLLMLGLASFWAGIYYPSKR